LLIGCGGTDTPLLTNGEVQNTSPDATTQSDNPETGDVLFPPDGPIIDPVSTREEIAQRADTLLIEYRIFMREVVTQMNEVYQLISSGLESSSDPDIQANHIQFVNTVNNACDPQFDNNGVLTGLSNCNNLSAQFALRHPRYANVQVLVTDYVPTANFSRGDETTIYIASGRYSIFDNSFVSTDVVSIVTGKYKISTDGSSDIPMVYLGFPAFSLDRQICMVYLSPTRLPEDSLELNRCSEMYKDIITVIKRLNSTV